MIANFFQSLSREQVDYLLISGQATVLYGAATFSEDIDLWVAPGAANIARLQTALRALRASYYKLTPPLQEEYVQRGHGFHFLIPDDDDSVFLDIMGRPPRVGSFDQAAAAARLMPTDWGELPTVGIQDLVALKRTQRLADYPVIGRLVLCFLEETTEITAAAAEWALANIFTVDELVAALRLRPELVEFASAPIRTLAPPPEQTEIDDAVRGPVEALLLQRIQQSQQADRQYWRAIIAELRELRSQGGLIASGTPV